MADLAAAYVACDAALRRDDRDTWLAALFVPVDKRPFVHALYAFALEAARIRDIVSEPTLGEIRLQWWRDILDGVATGEAAAHAGGHPTAEALLDTILRADLPGAPLLQLLDARSFDLYDMPIPSQAVLDGYIDGTMTGLMRLAAQAIDGPGAADHPALAAAGAACGLTRMLRALPFDAARGAIYLPADMLVETGVDPDSLLAKRTTPALLALLVGLRARARQYVAEWTRSRRGAPPGVAIASLPASLCPLYLRAMEQPGYEPFVTPTDVPQWRRQWSLWRAS